MKYHVTNMCEHNEGNDCAKFILIAFSETTIKIDLAFCINL
jgi:hypothetical protein